MKFPRSKTPNSKVSSSLLPGDSQTYSDRVPKSSSSWHYINVWWLWEFAGWILATGCLSAIVGVLLKYNGHPLLDWPYSITLNSVLAILSAVSKSALLIPVAAGISQLKWTRFNQQRRLIDLQTFDDASRGPMGSLMLIFRGGWLAFIGTLIVITALAVEPFIQQIVSYSTELVDSAVGLATIPRTGEYNAYDVTAPGGGANMPTIPSDLKASIYTGIYGNGTQVQPVCTTGNCTWQSFDSLAVCSSCADVTQLITVSDFQESTLENGKEYATCNMSLPLAGFVPAQYAYRQEQISELHLEYNGSSYIMVTLSMLPGTTGTIAEHNEINSTVAAFTAIYLTDSYQTDCRTDHGNVTATECVLYWCVKTFNAEVDSTFFTETSSSPRSLVHNTTERFRAFYLNDAESYIQYNVSNGMGMNANNGWGGQGTEDFLTLNVFPPGNATSKHGINAAGSNDVADLLSRAASRDFAYGKTVANPSGAEGLGLFMSKISDSMSANVRTYADDRGPAIGTAREQEIFIHVRWPWLILPLLLDVLALVFLIIVIVLTKKSKTQVWKSSQMVTIFHGFSARERIHFDDVHGSIDMEDVARSIQAKLVPDADGKRLSKID